MIRFSCKSCGRKLTVDEKHAGKRIKCPKCGSSGVVPDSSNKIRFRCDNCGQSISVPSGHAGRKGKCPKCKAPIVVPSPDSDLVGSVTSAPSIPSEPDDGAYADEEAYEDGPKRSEEEETGGLDRRVILAIGGGAVVVVGLIVLVAVILLSGRRPVPNTDVSLQTEVADAGSRSDPDTVGTQQPGVSTPRSMQESAAPVGPTPSSLASGDDVERFDLRLRLEPGQKRSLRLVRKINSSQTLDGRQSDVNSVNTMGLAFEVDQVDANGVAWVKVICLTIHDVTETARGRNEYDSTRPDSAGNHPAASLFSAMIGQSFTAKVTPDGEIVELAGLDDMYRRMAGPVVKARAEEAARGGRASPPPTAERIDSTRKWLEMNSCVGKQTIVEMLDDIIAPLPEGAVSVGESWQAETALPARATGFPVSYRCTCRLGEASQEAARVDIDSVIQLDDEPVSGGDAPGLPQVTLTGSYRGSSEIDLSAGWLLYENMILNCSGEVKTAPSEQYPQGRTIGISTEITTTVEPLE